MRTKRLALGKEVLGDLTPDELAGIAGGTETLHSCRPPLPCLRRTIVECLPTFGGCANTVDICIPTRESVCVCS